MMNPEIKTKWLEALRSGKYKQGKNFLRIEDRFCCLGVLCDIIDPTKWSDSGHRNNVTYEGCQTMPTRDFLQAVGIPKYPVMDGQLESCAGAFAEMNDNGKTFEEIAAAIEVRL